MGKSKLGRPANDDWFWWLKPLVRRAEADFGLLEVCTLADCVKGRKSIRDWLDGRKSNATGVTTERGLPEVYGNALMTWLKTRPEYAGEINVARKQALDWLKQRQMDDLEAMRQEKHRIITGLAKEYRRKVQG